MIRSPRELRFLSPFVDALPGDPRQDNATRQVRGACWSAVAPTPVKSPQLLVLVPEVAAQLGLSPDAPPEEVAQLFGGNQVPDGARPYAACYGGHQFGNWAGQLGDGRVITLGEVVGPDGVGREVQLKGAGPTPYSRFADGRAVLRSSLRELVASEAMHHLGVPTTRALSLVLTGEGVVRDMFYDGRAALEPGAICARVAPSFLRMGSYELPASLGDTATLRQLVDYTLRRYFPGATVPEFFAQVCHSTARLMVEWLRVGFVHGVMNTDNLSILGLTIDYGPYGFLDTFDPGWTPNTTDAGTRRYRYGNQPQIGLWNLSRLASALAEVCPDHEALGQALEGYRRDVDQQQRAMFLSKLGLPAHEDSAMDAALLGGLFELLTGAEVDMTLFFRGLARVRRDDPELGDAPLRPALYGAPPPSWAAWLGVYRERLRAQGVDDAARAAAMERVNPLYVPRNYLLHEVIQAATAGDTAPLLELLDVLRAPYTEQPGRERWAGRRPDWARHQPGCSTLSCSS